MGDNSRARSLQKQILKRDEMKPIENKFITVVGRVLRGKTALVAARDNILVDHAPQRYPNESDAQNKTLGAKFGRALETVLHGSLGWLSPPTQHNKKL